MTFSQNSEIKDHKPKAWIISLSIYATFLAALYFIKIAYEPVEEPIALGVDLNYGVDLVGSGDIQTLNKANASKNNYDVKPAEKTPETKPQKTQYTKPEVSKPTPQKSVSKPAAVLTSDEDTKVTYKKATEPAKTTSNSSNSTKSSPMPAPPKPQPTVDQGSIFKKSSNSGSSSNGTVGTRSGVGGNNNGDGKPGEVGDKGDPRGTLDGKSLYGNPGKGGGSSGASVSISGWKNRGPLNIPKDNSNETGRIRFKVVIDDYGDVVKIDVLETSVSPSVTNYYKSQITRQLKSNLVPEGTPPPRSNGTITINITRGA